jgi:hypothetical protein
MQARLSAKVFEQLPVGFREFELLEIAGIHPAQVRNGNRSRFAFDNDAIEKM